MPRRDDDSDLDPPRRRRPPPRRKSETSTALILVAVGSAILLFAGGVAVAAYLILREQPGGGVAGTGGSDLERLAGSWESTFRDPAGRVTMHKVKEIVGNTETATWYQPDGRVFRINRVQFELTTR